MFPGRHSSRRSARASRRDLNGRRYPRPPPTCSRPPDPPFASRARPVRAGYSPIRRRDLTLPTFARASLGDARGRRPISSPVDSSRPGSASASRRRASRRAAAEGDGAGDRDEDSGQSSVAEAETNAAADADSYNVAEEMPDTIPYKSRDSADEDDDDDIELPGPGANAEAVKPAKGKDRACAFFPCSVPFLPSFCYMTLTCLP